MLYQNTLQRSNKLTTADNEALITAMIHYCFELKFMATHMR